MKISLEFKTACLYMLVRLVEPIFIKHLDATFHMKDVHHYGFKLYSLISIDRYTIDFILASTNIDDRKGLWELTNKTFSLTIIGDKGYIGNNISLELNKERDINLISMKRSNSKIQPRKSVRQVIFKKHRLTETVNFQLSEQLNISKVLTKSR